jgi:ABC-2 type transport system permease protein
MFKRFRLYLPFVNAGIQQSVVYRLDFFLFRLGDLLGAVVVYFLWRAIFWLLQVQHSMILHFHR